jgi:formate dehydrogenase maturation protein FdhE
MEITQNLYIMMSGQICPHCGSKDQVRIYPDFECDPGVIYTTAQCSNCKSCWEEEYHLAGFNKKGEE